MLTTNSAKELEHFERIRQSFESVDKKKQQQQQQQKQDNDPESSTKAPPQTIGEALEALRLSGEQIIDGPVLNGDPAPTSPTKGKRHVPVRTASGHSTTSSKGKSKTVGRKGKAVSGGGVDGGGEESDDSSLDGASNKGKGAPGGQGTRVNGEGDDDYVVKTDHLAGKEVEEERK